MVRLYAGLAHSINMDCMHPTEALVVAFIVFLAKNFKTQKTVRSLLSTLTNCLRRAGIDVSAFERDNCGLLARSISINKRTATVQRPPVDVQTLTKVVGFWRKYEPHGHALATAALIMFSTSVRQSNLLPTTQHAFDRTRQLVWQDILWRRTYVKINIKWGKAQQKTTTKYQKIPRAAAKHICTISALERLKASRRPRRNSPVISFPDGKPIPVSYVSKKWRQAMVALGMGAVGLTLHSLRRGGARYLQDQGASPSQIACHGGWKSKAVFDYIHPPNAAATYSALKHLS